jgi:HAMP domain-containing protein
MPSSILESLGSFAVSCLNRLKNKILTLEEVRNLQAGVASVRLDGEIKGNGTKRQASKNDELRETKEELKKMMDRFSELHNAFNRQAQQTDVRFSLRYADIRSRFLSTFRRDFMGEESRENQRSSTGETSPLTTDSL